MFTEFAKSAIVAMCDSIALSGIFGVKNSKRVRSRKRGDLSDFPRSTHGRDTVNDLDQ